MKHVYSIWTWARRVTPYHDHCNTKILFYSILPKKNFWDSGPICNIVSPEYYFTPHCDVITPRTCVRYAMFEKSL